MTIFDVLRYPISRPPTRDQLNALPHPVYVQWCKQIGFQSIIPEKAFIVGLLRMPTDPDFDKDIPNEDECYATLTRILLEYKDDDLR